MKILLFIYLFWVYISGVFYPVVQQPTRLFVSARQGVITQYSSARNFGLLAHNDKAGAVFADLQIGDLVIVYGAHQAFLFRVDEILAVRAPAPNYFQDLATGEWYTGRMLFDLVYSDGLTLQTCITDPNNPANLTWGRLFVRAVPGEYVTRTDN